MTPVLALLHLSFLIYRKNAALFAGYVAWLLLPLMAAGVFRLVDLGQLALPLGVTLLTINGILWLWIFTLLARATDAIVRKRKINQVALSKVSWRLLVPVAASFGLLIIAILGGAILLVVPAFIFLIWFALGPIATALEGQPALISLGKSRELITGRFWPAAWRILGGPFLILLGYAFFMSILLIMFLPATGLTLEQVEANEIPLWLQLIDAVIQIFLLPWVVIYLTLVYRELKSQVSKK